jgi:predicted double-glycine peptidase
MKGRLIMKNNNFSLGVYAFASILGFVAGGLFTKTQFNKELAETDELAEQIDIFEEES